MVTSAGCRCFTTAEHKEVMSKVRPRAISSIIHYSLFINNPTVWYYERLMELIRLAQKQNFVLKRDHEERRRVALARTDVSEKRSLHHQRDKNQ
jgi:hypothetical protein